jgi:hypothetical protein
MKVDLQRLADHGTNAKRPLGWLSWACLGNLGGVFL